MRCLKYVQHTSIVDHNQHTSTDTSASQYIVTFLTHQVLLTQVHLDTSQKHNNLPVYLCRIYSRCMNNFTCFLNYAPKTARKQVFWIFLSLFYTEFEIKLLFISYIFLGHLINLFQLLYLFI